MNLVRAGVGCRVNLPRRITPHVVTPHVVRSHVVPWDVADQSEIRYLFIYLFIYRITPYVEKACNML